MGKRLFILLCALAATGCFFGGENDAATEYPLVARDPADTVPRVEPPRVRFVTPGTYVGDYTWIDSNVYELESELVLEAKGTFHLGWIQKNENIITQNGEWSQRDSQFFFKSILETYVGSDSLFRFSDSLEDDTNLVRNLTDTSFLRLEWTPLRQKPYWIPYRRRIVPGLQEGVYILKKSYPDADGEKDYVFTIELKEDEFLLTVSLEGEGVHQSSARWAQVGSFLSLEELREHEADSTGAFPEEWRDIFGRTLKRLDAVSDTGFSVWTPTSARHPIGNWDVFRKEEYRAPPQEFASPLPGML